MKTGNIFWYHLMAIITVAIWGTTFVSTKVLIGYGLSPVEILFYRFLIAYICIWIISPRKIFSRTWRDELCMVAMGMCGGSLYFISENTALGITLASNVALIICTTPILVAFLSKLTDRKQQLSRNLWIGSAIALTGVALVVFNGNFILKINPLGDILTIIAALMWAFYCLILKRMNTRYPTLFITRKVFFYGIVTILPFLPWLPVRFDSLILFTPVVTMNLLFLGMVASMLCYIMWNTAVKMLGPLYTSNYIYIVPLVTMVTSALIINEVITAIAITGCCFILVGDYLAERKIPVNK